MCVISAWAWFVLPENKQLAVHWDIFGRPDGYAPKAPALLILPVVMLLVTCVYWRLLGARTHKDPEIWRKTKLAAYISIFGALIVLLEAHCAIVLTAFGYALPVAQIILGSLGVLLAAIGGTLAAGKTARNPWVGIRNAWTIKDDVVWDKTNRLGGWIMLLCGIGTTCGAVFSAVAGAASLIIGVFVLLIASYAAAYYHWKKRAL